jgi:large subunit ribosomal protein L47
MARIKAVINERRLAYERAVKLVEKQRERAENEKVLQYKVGEFRKERKYLVRRQEYVARKREARRKKAEEEAQMAKMIMAEANKEEGYIEQLERKAGERGGMEGMEKNTEDMCIVESQDHLVQLERQAKEGTPRVEETKKATPVETQAERLREVGDVEVVEERSTPSPPDAATAALFENPTLRTTRGRRRP